jgi:hypothetical protein
MRIIVTGLVGQFAFGGVAWDYLQYVEGFRRLGHDVVYLEDTENWPYNAIQQTYTADCTANVAYLRAVMERFGFDGRWIYRNCPDSTYHGMTEAETRAVCAHADLFVNVSGCGWLRPEYAAIPKKIFIDSDPLFTQVALLHPNRQARDRTLAHTVHFTFAENIGGPDCRIPDAGIRWLPTRQPIILDWWPVAATTPRDVFTTVMNWNSYKPVEHDGTTWGQKNVELERFIELPRHTPQKLELACGQGGQPARALGRLRQCGWEIVDPDLCVPDPWRYREYLSTSKGEWSVAKEGYVKSRSGWFSCRSACYLALGRPCVLQDTGWSHIYPTGNGLWAFQNMDEAVAGLAAVNADYAAQGAAARRVAENMFDASRVLGELLERVAGSSA